MLFEIRDGLGLIKISADSRAEYFQYSKPISIIWDDYQGSIGQFLTTSKENKFYRNFVEAHLKEAIYIDFSENFNEAYNFVKPLLTLFQNGKYKLKFSTSENKIFFIKGNESESHSWDIHICNSTNKEIEDEVKIKHRELLFERPFPKIIVPLSLLEYTTHNFYPIGIDLLGTQPKESISNERVDFYRNEIKNGKRPFAIVMSKGVTHFVIDGHHKLLAYRELNIYPPILSLEVIKTTDEGFSFDREAVKSIIYSWQYENIYKE
ncbi:MAG: hypothetical protein EOO46_03795 [Flavobacterium sp.]|nr:MAG: hypothetical protein EOO46_03795 [Flavobacterium sp.]